MKKEEEILKELKDNIIKLLEKSAYDIGKETGKLGYNDQEYADKYISKLLMFIPNIEDRHYEIFNADFWKGYDEGLSIDD